MKLFIRNISEFRDRKSFDAGLSKLGEERRQKVFKIKNENERLLSLAAGMAFLDGLDYYGIDREAVSVVKGEHGKPDFLRGNKKPGLDESNGEMLPFFNISHSGEMAVAAFDEREIGVDVEQIKKRHVSSVLRKFTEAERDYVRAEKTLASSAKQDNSYIDDDIDAIRRMLEIWTLKESFLKCIGTGITMELDCVELIPRITESIVFEGEKYEFSQEITDGEYIVSVCTLMRA